MKKTLFLLSFLILASCATPGRTCGGGRKRCVKVEKPLIETSNVKIS
jgi:uncharacterized lipoprotein YajG